MGILKDFLTYGEDVQKYNKEIYFFQIRNNFTLPHKLFFGIDAEYSTNGNSNLAYVYGASSINLYLTKLFLNDKLRVSLNGYDIFNKDRKKREIFPENVRIFQDGDQNSRRLTVSVNYMFNSTKSKYRGQRATNELNRL